MQFAPDRKHRRDRAEEQGNGLLIRRDEVRRKGVVDLQRVQVGTGLRCIEERRHAEIVPRLQRDFKRGKRLAEQIESQGGFSEAALLWRAAIIIADFQPAKLIGINDSARVIPWRSRIIDIE